MDISIGSRDVAPYRRHAAMCGKRYEVSALNEPEERTLMIAPQKDEIVATFLLLAVKQFKNTR